MVICLCDQCVRGLQCVWRGRGRGREAVEAEVEREGDEIVCVCVSNKYVHCGFSNCLFSIATMAHKQTCLPVTMSLNHSQKCQVPAKAWIYICKSRPIPPLLSSFPSSLCQDADAAGRCEHRFISVGGAGVRHGVEARQNVECVVACSSVARALFGSTNRPG